MSIHSLIYLVMPHAPFVTDTELGAENTRPGAAPASRCVCEVEVPPLDSRSTCQVCFSSLLIQIFHMSGSSCPLLLRAGSLSSCCFAGSMLEMQTLGLHSGPTESISVSPVDLDLGKDCPGSNRGME